MNNETECFNHESSRITKETLWQVFSLLVQVVLRLFPTVMICCLNIWMYFKLKDIQRHRDKIFGIPKESTTASDSAAIHLHTSFGEPIWSRTRTIKHKINNMMYTKNEDNDLTTISEVVSRVRNVEK